MKTSKMTRLIGKTTLVITLILIGCSDLKEGVVINKYIVPEHDWFYLMPIQSGKATTWVPMNGHSETQYLICIKKDAYTRDLSVSRPLFESTKIGQYVKVTE